VQNGGATTEADGEPSAFMQCSARVAPTNLVAPAQPCVVVFAATNNLVKGAGRRGPRDQTVQQGLENCPTAS
jgi:hypothetical protein